jgi:hypothetical protein
LDNRFAWQAQVEQLQASCQEASFFANSIPSIMSAFHSAKESTGSSSGKKSTSRSSGSEGSDEGLSATNPFAFPLPDHLSRLIQASRLLLATSSHATDTRVALLRVVDGILNSPTEPKFRQLRGDNSFVRKNLTEPPGGLAFLYAVGFAKQKIDDKAFLVWEPIPSENPKFDEFLNLRAAHDYLVHIDSVLSHTSRASTSSRSSHGRGKKDGGALRTIRVRLPTGAILKGMSVCPKERMRSTELTCVCLTLLCFALLCFALLCCSLLLFALLCFACFAFPVATRIFTYDY